MRCLLSAEGWTRDRVGWGDVWDGERSDVETVWGSFGLLRAFAGALDVEPSFWYPAQTAGSGP